MITHRRVLLNSPTDDRWFMAAGLPPLIAYAAQGALSQADSYINLANPGRNNAALGTAPAHSIFKGWTFTGTSAQWLDTGYIFKEGQTFLIEYKYAGEMFICGAYNGSKGISLVPGYSAGISYWYGAPTVRSPLLASGIVGYSGNQPYRNGVKDGAALSAWGGTINVNFGLGKMNGFSSYLTGDILRFVLWDNAISEAAVLNTYNAMIADNKTYVAFGDSVTVGLNVTDATHRWPNIIARVKGWNLQNSGVSGTVLQNTVQNTVTTIGGAVSGNGRDTYVARVTVYNPGFVTILYGVNDLRLNDAAFTAANFQTDLEQIIDGIVAAGTPASKIIIGSPPYVPVATYTREDYAPWNGGSAAIHAQYTAATAAAAAAKGTKYIDVYQAMADGGGDTLIDADGVHPNDAGHAVIARAFLSVMSSL